MKTKTFSLLLSAATALLTITPAQADWSDLWTDVEQLGDKAQQLGQKAWDEVKKEWNKLELNYDLLQAFGNSVGEDSALIGRFYDLKQPIDGKAKPLTKQAVVDLFHQFNKKKWDQELFNAYYSPKVRLYAPYFYLPRCKASYGPEAFQCNANAEKGEPKVSPTAWVVVYRGVVTAPKTGTFRFVGMGDDTLMVRFNNKLVLESGWSIPTRSGLSTGTNKNYQQEITEKAGPDNRHNREITPKTKGRALYQYATTPHWNRMLGGLPSGVPFSVKKGEKYPIEILVSEVPGNEFGFCLLIEELESAAKAPYGIFSKQESPTLHLFRTADTLPDAAKIKRALSSGSVDYSISNCEEGPPFRDDSLIWEADFEDAEKRGLFERLFGKLTGKDKDTAMGTSHKQQEDESQPNKKDESEEENILDSWRLW